MKRFALIITTFVVLFNLAYQPDSLAEEFDMSIFRRGSEFYSIHYEKGIAYITSTETTKSLAFTHKYESKKYYSSTRFDFIIPNYLEEDPYAVFRLWIDYNADDIDYMYINSVSFIFLGKEYTFSGVANKDWYEQDDNGYREQLLIKIDSDNIAFVYGLYNNLFFDKETKEFSGIPKGKKVKMVLHGREDLEIELGDGFITDLFFMTLGLMNSHADAFLDKIDGTKMKVTDIQ